MADQQVERTIEAHFEIVDFEETVYEEPAEGPKLTRVTLRKHYQGAIDGTGVAEVLTAQGAAGGGYVASERIEGTLDGRQGTFVIQQTEDCSRAGGWLFAAPQKGAHAGFRFS